MNLAESTVCELASQPGVDKWWSPVVMEYISQRQAVAVCGNSGKDDRSCYSLRPGTPPTWQPIPPLVQDHCPYPFGTSSHYTSRAGWFVFGQDKSNCGSYPGSSLVSELLNNDQEWLLTTLSSPYPDGFPSELCSVLLNATTIMVTGGVAGYDGLSSTFLLDLDTLAWTEAAPMKSARFGHGCTVTREGNVLVAGGTDGPSVHIYHPDTDSWTVEQQNLPNQIYSYNSYILLWNHKPILLSPYSQEIWERTEENSWELMTATLGANFDGSFYNTAVMVPSGLYECP